LLREYVEMLSVIVTLLVGVVVLITAAAAVAAFGDVTGYPNAGVAGAIVVFITLFPLFMMAITAVPDRVIRLLNL
jgi:hypothetical protein